MIELARFWSRFSLVCFHTSLTLFVPASLRPSIAFRHRAAPWQIAFVLVGFVVLWAPLSNRAWRWGGLRGSFVGDSFAFFDRSVWTAFTGSIACLYGCADPSHQILQASYCCQRSTMKRQLQGGPDETHGYDSQLDYLACALLGALIDCEYTQ